MAMSMSRVRHPPVNSQIPPSAAAALPRPQDSGGVRPPRLQQLQRSAGRPDRRGDATESAERRGDGGLAVKVRRLVLCVGATFTLPRGRPL